MEVEIIPSPQCDDCDSYNVIVTDKGQECDDCDRVTMQSSDYIKRKKSKFNNLTTKLGDI